MGTASRLNLDRDFDRALVDAAALAGATDAFATPLTAFGSVPLIRVAVVLNTTSVVNVVEVLGGVTVTHTLNQATAVVAGDSRAFDVPAVPGATYQLQVVTPQAASAWKRSLQVVLL